MQKLENRCDLLLTQHQKWMASVTRFIVAHGMGSPHLHGYHRLTLAHFFSAGKRHHHLGGTTGTLSGSQPGNATVHSCHSGRINDQHSDP